MGNEDLDIFVVTYKDFEPAVHNKAYRVIDSREIDQSDYPLSDRFFSELSCVFYIADHAEELGLKKYVGINHYRRFFSFMDEIPNMDEIFEKYDVILPTPTKFTLPVKEQYAYYHNVDDLILATDIVKEKYPDYSKVVDSFLKSGFMFTCDMFIMKKEDFLEYAKFMKDVLFELVNRIGTDIKLRIEKNKEKYLKSATSFKQNNEVWYQYRIGGYVGERLSNIFYGKKFSKIKMFKIRVTEGKYDKGIIDDNI